MPEYTPIPMGLTIGKGLSRRVSVESLDNMYAVPAPSNARHPVSVRGVPGLKLWSTVGDGPCRALQRLGDHIFVLSGTELYVVNQGKVATRVGSIPGAGHVPSIANGSAETPEALFLGPDDAYRATASSLPTGKPTLSAVGLPGYTDVTYQDGRAILAEKSGEKFQLSDLDDFSSFNLLNFSAADAFGDDLVGCISDHGELILFGTRSIEIWSNTAGAFQFSRSYVLEKGCLSRDSIKKADNSVYFLGEDDNVYRLAGTQLQSISPGWVISLLRSSIGKASARAKVFVVDGHTIYSLKLSNLVVEYNTSTGLWNTRSSYGLNTWRAEEHVSAFGMHLLGDDSSGNIYELDLDTHTENGELHVRTMNAPPVYRGGNRFQMGALFAEFEGGVGLATGQGSDPVCMMSFSDNDGVTWSTEVNASIGISGDYENIAMWRRLGMSRNRTFRLRVSDPVKSNISGLYSDMEVMN